LKESFQLLFESRSVIFFLSQGKIYGKYCREGNETVISISTHPTENEFEKYAK
jgi:hypothetical protein